MKNVINSFRIGLIILSIASLYSCEKKSIDGIGIGTAEFSISVPDVVSMAKSGTVNDSAAVSFQIMISVEDMAGNAAFTDKLIPIYAFGTGFVSENVEINAGEFKLTKFMVINPTGTVLYAAPLAGSPLAYLTTKPLPFKFNISLSQVTRVSPEVLPVGDQTPDKFGYATFGMQIIKPLNFWTLCVLDPGNPMIMAPIQLTTAKLTVYTPYSWHYSFKLEASVNHLVIRGGSEVYYFLLEKEDYLPIKLQFNAKELLSTSPESPLVLKIPRDSNVIPTATPGTSLWYGAVLQQIIEPWEEGKVTWNTQPKTTEMNQVFLSPFIRNVNSVELDVTRLIVSPAANPLPNYGMLFKLFPDEKFLGFRFASSDFPEMLMRPKLTIFYTL